MAAAILIYTTAGSPAEAEAIAETVIGQGLAACANIFPAMTSVYRWKGEIARETETAMILKTVPAHRDAAMDAVRACHPYETPAILALPVEKVDAAYLSWLLAETDSAG